MGTRSIIKIYDANQPIVAIYQQYDGCFDGVGLELALWLKDKKIINGFNLNQTMEKGYVNGMGCLAAQFVKDFKTVIGGLYLTNLNAEEAFNYEVHFINNQLMIHAYGDEDEIYKLTPDEFIKKFDKSIDENETIN